MVANIIQLLFDIVMLGIFIFSAIDDAKTRIVRPRYQIAALAVAVAHLIFAFIAYGWEVAVLHYLLAGIGMFAIYITLFLVFKSGIGGADTKMSSILALYLGIIPGIIMVVVHSLAGGVYAAYMEAVHHKHIRSVPLMVFLSIGLVVAQLVAWIIRLA